MALNPITQLLTQSFYYTLFTCTCTHMKYGYPSVFSFLKLRLPTLETLFCGILWPFLILTHNSLCLFLSYSTCICCSANLAWELETVQERTVVVSNQETFFAGVLLNTQTKWMWENLLCNLWVTQWRTKCWCKVMMNVTFFNKEITNHLKSRWCSISSSLTGYNAAQQQCAQCRHWCLETIQ